MGGSMLNDNHHHHPFKRRRRILVVDDEAVNRELLGHVLEDEYDVLFAENGAQALQVLQENKASLSLVLLDLMMPVMNGTDVLRHIREDASTARLPVIVLTSDQSAEIDCLNLGAIDFIPKPYPQPGVIHARIRRIIELSEDQDTIRFTERDTLTGLYNREYFYRYSSQLDQFHPDTDMDAIVLDVFHFRMINERYGTAFGDKLLRQMAENILAAAQKMGGMACRREADTFLVYLPHLSDYESFLAQIPTGEAPVKARLRMGVYASVDKTIDIERRFDRAKIAADTIRTSVTHTIALYDADMHEKELYQEQLVEDFRRAIDEEQFKVFYQPKFDIRPDTPVLSSAEALVRWFHPELGMISPGIFIPLFEENGLIYELDTYVWEHTAAQIQVWKQNWPVVTPVSVNVSRIDLYDPRLPDTLQSILDTHGLCAEDLLLEITESAYTQNADQMIAAVNHLRNMGFHIEMDDFGTGYSSLNMLSRLPVDTLKLDMQFIRSAFSGPKDTRMLEVIMEIAERLHVPVIAEGVETQEQLDTLKAMGCAIVQGYYFSKPVPENEFAPFLSQRADYHGDLTGNTLGNHTLCQIEHALSVGFDSIYYVDTTNGHYTHFSTSCQTNTLQISHSGTDFFGDTQQKIPDLIPLEEQAHFASALSKDTLMAHFQNHPQDRPFTIDCHILIQGAPVSCLVKAVRASDLQHIVIGICRFDRGPDQFAVSGKSSLNFQSLSRALAIDLESIYYVDAVTDDYMAFHTNGAYGTLHLKTSGEQFFDACQKDILCVVYPDDREKVSRALEKSSLLDTLSRRHAYCLDYRLVIGGRPVYYRLKATMATDNPHHLIIGVTNIDEQITDEQRLNAERQSIATYARVAQALAQDYFSIYYVDARTDHFIEYSAYDDYTALGIEKSGDDFFTVSRKNIHRVVHPDDVDAMLTSFQKEVILRELENNHTFTLSYRLMFHGEPTYVRLKATRMDDDGHIVIGVYNVDAEMRRLHENITYSAIAQALAADYFCIYYVNTETNQFIEYSSDSKYKALNLDNRTEDFFLSLKENTPHVVHPDDQKEFLRAMTKDNLLSALSENGTFTLTYRILFGGVPNYVHLKATTMADKKDPHIVIGISSIDAQVRREQEHERQLASMREMANRDALTGVKNKHAYLEIERQKNLEIRNGTAAFAVAVCDINGLKTVNDSLGHAAGDECICHACSVICNIFKHSPVFRIGGDEFAIVLSGQDYEHRHELLHQIQSVNQNHLFSKEVTIACGMSDYQPEDPDFETVFKRSDAKMYENKTDLKTTVP